MCNSKQHELCNNNHPGYNPGGSLYSSRSNSYAPMNKVGYVK